MAYVIGDILEIRTSGERFIVIGLGFNKVTISSVRTHEVWTYPSEWMGAYMTTILNLGQATKLEKLIYGLQTR